MKVQETIIEGCYLFEPTIFNDKRGYFFESYNQRHFQEAIELKVKFVQDNEAFSTKGVLRGLHFQKANAAQAKLVRVLQGEVLDVVVDIRPKSNSFKKVVSMKISDTNKKQLFMPRGCAHGYVVLSKTATFFYKCDNFYTPDAEAGIRWDDNELNIDWLLSKEELIISERDRNLPYLETLITSLK